MLIGNDNAEIGRRIYERRKQLNITQEKLSELANTTPQAISNYERGERELKASIIIKLASALNTTTDYILTGNDNAFVLHDIENITDRDKTTIFEIVEKCIELLK